MLLSEAKMSDHKGARLILDALPPAKSLIADRGYDSTWFREELAAKGIEPCIPSSRSRKRPFPDDRPSTGSDTRSRTRRQAQRLAPHRDPPRSLRSHLLLSHMPRSSRNLLALIQES